MSALLQRACRAVPIALAFSLMLSIAACNAPPSDRSQTAASTELSAASAAARSPATALSAAELDNVLSAYKTYVIREVNALVVATQEFTAAVKAGDLDRAQSLYAGARQHYERIEPAAELFSDLDGAIDARADDFAQKEKDPTWTGFHRIEMTLFRDKTTEGLTPLANQLMKDVNTLKAKVATLEIKPKEMVGGAADLIEEVSATKITGEEDRYSGADLSDFQANLDGSKQIVELLRPQLQTADAALLSRIDQNFQKIDAGIAKYQDSSSEFNGYVSYDQLSETDRKALQTTLAALAEDLSLLRGTLGVS